MNIQYLIYVLVCMISVSIVYAQQVPNLPLIQQTDILYVGAFRLPQTMSCPQDRCGMGYSNGALGYKQGNPGTLFVSCHVYGPYVAEITIPTPVISSSLDDLNAANYVQTCADPLAGAQNPNTIWGSDYLLGGFLVFNGKLISTGYLWYDAGGSQDASHYVKNSLNLSVADASGPYAITAPTEGFVSGFMHSIPSEWQAVLGGPYLAGQNGFSIISRGSFGPAALSFDPATLGPTSAPSHPLVYYPMEHHTLGDWNETYNGTTVKWNNTGGYKNMIIVDSTRTCLAIGHQGVGRASYGPGTTDSSLDGTMSPSGDPWCYDPAYPDDKGDHAYPYRLQIMAYDVADFAAVAAGTINPWDVQPYAIWPIAPPNGGIRTGGVVWDPVQRRVYLSVTGLANGEAIIYVYSVARLSSGTADNSISLPGANISISPNPCNPAATISVKGLQVSMNQNVEVRIYSIHGTCVSRIQASALRLSRGISWDASSHASGTYIARIEVGGRTISRPLIVMK